MDVKLVGKTKEKITFVIKDTSYVFANTLRKLVIDEVPTMAIEDVEFRQNSSVLYDEVIAHRLGLLPLTTDLKAYNVPAECTCKGEGCAKCTVTLSCKAEGPGTVFASDLKSKDPGVVPVYPKMPITVLEKGQELSFEATAVLGRGRDHAKFTPGWAFYRKLPTIEIKANCKDCGKCVEACPVNVFEMKSGKLKVDKDNLYKCNLCNTCIESCPSDSIKIMETDDFLFEVESYGSLDLGKIIPEAVSQMTSKLEEFEKKIKE